MKSEPCPSPQVAALDLTHLRRLNLCGLPAGRPPFRGAGTSCGQLAGALRACEQHALAPGFLGIHVKVLNGDIAAVVPENSVSQRTGGMDRYESASA